jgi:uncharacterized lipoprotein NlpE involved in copper resistance
VLNEDSSFTLESTYLGSKDEKKSTEKGTFKIEKDQVQLSLKDAPSMCQIEKGALVQLDIEANKIENKLNYKLIKK